MHFHWSVLQYLFLANVLLHVFTALFVTSLAYTLSLGLQRHLQSLQCKEITAIKNSPSLFGSHSLSLRAVITQAQGTGCSEGMFVFSWLVFS
jgi:hypothetical protein